VRIISGDRGSADDNDAVFVASIVYIFDHDCVVRFRLISIRD